MDTFSCLTALRVKAARVLFLSCSGKQKGATNALFVRQNSILFLHLNARKERATFVAPLRIQVREKDEKEILFWHGDYMKNGAYCKTPSKSPMQNYDNLSIIF